MGMTVTEAEELEARIRNQTENLQGLIATVGRGNMDVLEEAAALADKIAVNCRDLHEFTHQ